MEALQEFSDWGGLKIKFKKIVLEINIIISKRSEHSEISWRCCGISIGILLLLFFLINFW